MNECHISSLLMQLDDNKREQVSAHIAGIPGTQVHHQAGFINRLIIIYETNSPSQINKLIEQLQHLEGVYTVAMIYHQVCSEDTINEAIA